MANETAIEKRDGESTALAHFNWSREQIDLIKKTVAKETSDDELALFMHVCKRTGLDPLARQIYAIVRRSKNSSGEWVKTMVLQTGIDGYRIIAERTGKYRGVGVTEWCGPDGIWKDVWLDAANPPMAARVSVLRQDEGALEPIAIPGIALYREYVQTSSSGAPTQRWASGPAGQLAKCAEALALRRAFPNELSGIFTSDEMGQADTPREAPKVVQPTRKSERAPDKALKPAPAKGATAPVENPWTGDLDDIKTSPDKDFWTLHADQGRVTFFTDQVDHKDRAADAMSNGQQVKIEWAKTSVGNASVQTIVILQNS